MKKPTTRTRSLTTGPTGPEPVTATVTYRVLDSLTSAERKEYPLTTGLMDYFPDALAEVAHVSWMGNEKHNPGEPLHHARGKSNDHADCCARHLAQRGGFDTIVINGQERRVRHSVALAWRALALAQEELERDLGLDLPRGASA
jgi:Domain of unknown function (DUF5664)